MTTQLSFFLDPEMQPVAQQKSAKAARAGAFVDNMSLPVHRWLRYSAGFAAEWVTQVLADWKIDSRHQVLDPFGGSGTVPLVCDRLGIPSAGLDAHPVVARIARAKLAWTTSPARFTERANEVMAAAARCVEPAPDYPALVERSYTPETLQVLHALKMAWSSLDDGSKESELVWLAITAILRPTSTAGTAQWQYILPNKTKARVAPPRVAYVEQVEMMRGDLHWFQGRAAGSFASFFEADARDLASVAPGSVDAVITSPPYANNYDYADALRFEMTFWGDVSNWGDIHDKVRKRLIVSSSQHSSRERLALETLLRDARLAPIHDTLQAVTERLAEVRKDHGGKKHYHTMLAAYCRDIAQVLQALRRVCKPGARMCWVVGDSAPYGIYAPIDEWIGALAVAAGFRSHRFEKLRDRNTKWKNRKHQVPLKEGLLWIEG